MLHEIALYKLTVYIDIDKTGPKDADSRCGVSSVL